MRFFTGVCWFVLLVVRGVMLWLVIPFSVLSWLTVHRWAQRASIAQAVCWYDQNLLATLILIPFRVLRRLDSRLASTRLLSASEMSELKTYKISLVSDLA